MTDKEMLFEENFTCLLAAGTSEGLEVMRVLDKLHIKTAACVATELGAKMLRETGARVFVGRMDKVGFEKFISAHKVHFVIDATHPFAVEVTKNLKGAAEACGVSYAVISERRRLIIMKRLFMQPMPVKRPCVCLKCREMFC